MVTAIYLYLNPPFLFLKIFFILDSWNDKLRQVKSAYLWGGYEIDLRVR